MSNDAPYADIAIRIVQARTEYGYTQKGFAKEMGLTPRQWGEYEKGKVSPYKRLRRVAELTEVSYEWLLHGDVLVPNLPPPPNPSDPSIEAMRELTVELRRLNDWHDRIGGEDGGS